MASEDPDFQQEAGCLDDSEPTPLIFSDESHASKFFSNYDQLRERNKYTDITLVAEGKRIECHRVVLAAASPCLERRLDALLQGNQESIITFHTIKFNELEPIVKYCYTHNIRLNVSQVKGVARASKILQLTHLHQVCDRFISKRVSPKNAMGLLQFSTTVELPVTRAKAMKYLLTYPLEVLIRAHEVEFHALQEEYFVEWIGSDALVLEDESVIFKMALRWLEADLARKRDDSCVSNVLTKVRFPQLTPEFLLTTVELCPYMKLPKCQELLAIAKNCVIYPQLKKTMPGPQCRVRVPPAIVVLGGPYCRDEMRTYNSRMWVMSLDGTRCEEVSKLPSEQATYSSNMAVCVLGARVIITGGSKRISLFSRLKYFMERPGYRFDATNQAWAYDLFAGTWHALPGMKQNRYCHAMVMCGSAVLVCGGMSGDASLSSTERLGDRDQTWTSMAPMNLPVGHCFAVSTGDHVYVLDRVAMTTQKYDMMQNQWQVKAPMPGRCNNSTAVLGGQHIYIVGGASDIQCMVYSPQADAWAILKAPAMVHSNPAAIVYHNRLYLTGGRDRDGYRCSAIEEYDVETQTWSLSKLTLPAILSDHHALLTGFVWK